MKRFFVAIFILLVSELIFASPFGLKMGMKLKEIKKVCNGNELIHVEKDCFSFKPAKLHPLFDDYVIFVDEKYGLYCIKAITENIKTSKRGNEIKSAFNEIVERVSKIYGIPEILDKIKTDSLWDSDDYWTFALSERDRILAAYWEDTAETPMNDNLDNVVVYASAEKYKEEGWIVLEYTFKNLKKIEDGQDDVL